MSTELLEDIEQGLFLTRYHGGHRGTCYQITVADEQGYTKYIQLTKSQMRKLFKVYLDSILEGK